MAVNIHLVFVWKIKVLLVRRDPDGAGLLYIGAENSSSEWIVMHEWNFPILNNNLIVFLVRNDICLTRIVVSTEYFGINLERN